MARTFGPYTAYVLSEHDGDTFTLDVIVDARSRAKVDKDPSEWKYVDKGSCEKVGGKTSPGPGAPGKGPK